MRRKGMEREGSIACMVSCFLYPSLDAFSNMAAALGSYYGI